MGRLPRLNTGRSRTETKLHPNTIESSARTRDSRMNSTTRRVCMLLCLLPQVLHHVASFPIGLEGFQSDSGKHTARRLLHLCTDRPQNPKPPLPYISTNVTFQSSVDCNITLAGTFTVPNTPAPHPAVLLLSGSGPSFRDAGSASSDHKTFLVLADHLTRNGIAVLRYDDRGVGESTGNYSAVTSFGLADDAVGGLEWLKSREEVDSGAVGMLGHSEGGLLAPIAMSKLKEARRSDLMPAFAVLAAPPALPGGDILFNQTATLLRAAGLDDTDIARRLNATKEIIDLVVEVENVLDAEEGIREIMRELGLNKQQIDLRVKNTLTPWNKVFFSTDPLPFMRQVDCPVLALFGSKDYQIPPSAHEPKLKDAFSDNRDATIVVIEGANHRFQPAHTGLASEQKFICETIDPKVLDLITEWILERVG